jgi:hypothetical protein
MQVAPLLPHFLGPWCNALRNIRDDYEKEQAFRGLVAVVHKTPEPAVTAFPALASEYNGLLLPAVMFAEAQCSLAVLYCCTASSCVNRPFCLHVHTIDD